MPRTIHNGAICRRLRSVALKSARPGITEVFLFLLHAKFLMLLGAIAVEAQQRGPVTVHFVNDSGSKVDIIWLNHLKMTNGELLATQTGPLPPSSKQSYRAYVNDQIELRQVREECLTNHDRKCKSVLFRVFPAGDAEVQSNVFILSPDFKGTTTASEDSVRSLFGESIPATMRILNQSGGDIRLFWVNPKGLTLVPMSDDVIPSENVSPPFFSAKVFHQFLIQTSDGSTSVNFRVTHTDVDVTIAPGLGVSVELPQQEEDGPTPPSGQQSTSDGFRYKLGVDLFEQCRAYVLSDSSTESPDFIVEKIENCIKDNFDNVDWGFEANMSTYINDKLEDYTCSETRMATTEPIETRYWTSKHDQLTRYALILHQDEKSSIHLIPKFVSQEECRAVEEQADPHFEATQTTDAQGKLAMISPVNIPWEMEHSNDHIAKTGRRIFEYAKHILPGMDIAHEGQEPLLATHYYGRGHEDPQPDQFKSHCDTECTGKPLRDGQRVATMILYCATAEEGGHTNFKNARVHINPEPGVAVFITYVDPDRLVTDDGTTNHAGCPVYKGAKKIITQWIRHGVNNEHSYAQFPL